MFATKSSTLDRESVRSAITRALASESESLPAPEREQEFGRFFARYGGARVVLLGEATHGTSEFYQARAAITRELIAKHGFTVVAVEADWPDAARIDRYVRHRAPHPFPEDAFTRFPVWMWRNSEVVNFVEWLREFNEGMAPERRVSFHGLDVYSLAASIGTVINYLDRIDPNAAVAARRRYACLTPWQTEPADYGRAVLRGRQKSCEDEVTAQLVVLLSKRLEYIKEDGEAFFDAAQNARIVRAAEQYYRMMYWGARESWNLRDRQMFSTIQAVLAHRGRDAKAIVWAHNSHIGNAAATAMGWEGEFNIGELCRTAYENDSVLIGFGTDRGTVAAASEWGQSMEIKSVRPAREDSYEYAFRKTGLARSLTNWSASSKRALVDALSEPMLERAIGVVYRPQSEFASHYFEAVLADQFDAYVWFEESRAVTPLGPERPHGVPETWPFGL